MKETRKTLTLVLISLLVFSCNSEPVEKPETTRCKTPFILHDSMLRDSSIFSPLQPLNSIVSNFTNESGKQLKSIWHKKSPYMLKIIGDSTVFINIKNLIPTVLLEENIEFARLNSDNSFLLSYGDFFCLISQSGHTKIIYLPQANEEEIQNYYHYNFQRECYPYFSPVDSTIRYCVYAYYQDSVLDNHYAFPAVEAVYEFKSGNHRTLPSKKTTINIDKTYGFAKNFYRIANPDVSIYSWEADPDIVVYDINQNLAKHFDGKSAHDVRPDTRLEPSDFDNTTRKLQQLVEIGRYGNLVYNSNQHLYCRIFAQGIDLVRPDGLYNTIDDQPRYIQIFNKDFCLLDEVFIDSASYSDILLDSEDAFRIYAINRPKPSDSTFKYSKLTTTK